MAPSPRSAGAPAAADDAAVASSGRKPTPYEQRVYRLCSAIPKGKVTTYGELAKALDPPSAARAVGQAMRRNPFAPQVPCHRVVAATLEIGGFTGSWVRGAWVGRGLGSAGVAANAALVQGGGGGRDVAVAAIAPFRRRRRPRPPAPAAAVKLMRSGTDARETTGAPTARAPPRLRAGVVPIRALPPNTIRARRQGPEAASVKRKRAMLVEEGVAFDGDGRVTRACLVRAEELARFAGGRAGLAGGKGGSSK